MKTLSPLSALLRSSSRLSLSSRRLRPPMRLSLLVWVLLTPIVFMPANKVVADAALQKPLTVATSGGASTDGLGQGEQPVNINSASPALLASRLKGIGPSKAEAIVQYRETNGAFETVDALINVKGIGPKTLEKLRTQIVAGTFVQPAEGESLAEKEAAAREAVQAIIQRSNTLAEQAPARQ